MKTKRLPVLIQPRLLVVVASGGLLLGGLGLDTANATGASSSEGGLLGEGDVALRGGADDEGGGHDDLLGNGDVALTDEDASVVHGLGEADLVHNGLEATLENVGDGEGEDVIQLILVGLEESEVVAATEEGGTLKLTALVGLGEGQEGTGGTTHVGEGQVDAPDLTLAAEAVLSAHAELLLKTLALERPAGVLVHTVKVAVVAHDSFKWERRG